MSELEFLDRIILNFEDTIKFRKEHRQYDYEKDLEDDLEILELLRSIRSKVKFMNTYF